MICNRHVIALLYHQTVAIVVEAIVGETTMMLQWRSRSCAGDDGDHDRCFGDGDQRHKMMMAISYHLY